MSPAGDIVELNVGGTHFTTTKQTLTQRVSEVSGEPTAENKGKSEQRGMAFFFLLQANGASFPLFSFGWLVVDPIKKKRVFF